MGEHKSSEFGQVTRTTTGVSANDPELGQLAAPSLIILQGIDEETGSNPYIVRTPQPSRLARVPLWAWAVGLAIAFLVLGGGLWYLVGSGVLGPPSWLSSSGGVGIW